MRLFAGKSRTIQRTQRRKAPQPRFSAGSCTGAKHARLCAMVTRRLFFAAAALAPSGALAQPAPQGSRLIAATLYDDYDAKGFARWLSERRSFIVHVHAEWCSACRLQEARLKALLVDPAIRRLPFIRVDFDSERDFRQRYRITAQSTLIAFRDGREIARSVGETNAGALRDFVIQVM